MRFNKVEEDIYTLLGAEDYLTDPPRSIRRPATYRAVRSSLSSIGRETKYAEKIGYLESVNFVNGEHTRYGMSFLPCRLHELKAVWDYTNNRALTPITQNRLNLMDARWMSHRGVPTHYYVDELYGMIGVYPPAESDKEITLEDRPGCPDMSGYMPPDDVVLDELTDDGAGADPGGGGGGIDPPPPGSPATPGGFEIGDHYGS